MKLRKKCFIRNVSQVNIFLKIIFYEKFSGYPSVQINFGELVVCDHTDAVKFNYFQMLKFSFNFFFSNRVYQSIKSTPNIKISPITKPVMAFHDTNP